MKNLLRYLNIISILIIATNAIIFVSHAEIITIQPRIFIIFTAVVALLEFNFFKRKLTFNYLTKFYLFILVLFFAGLILTTFPEDALNLIRTQIYSIILIISLSILLQNKYVYDRIPKIIFYCSIFAVFFNIYEFFTPTSFMKVVGKSSGLYINPNSSAIALLCFGLIGIDYVKNQKLKMLYLVFVALGIFLTLSRAGIAISLIVFLFYFIKNKKQLFIITLTIIVTALLAPILIDKMANTFSSNDVGLNRYSLVTDLFESKTSIVENIEDDSRGYVAKQAFEMILDSPIFGYGLGAYRNIPYNQNVLETHNIYLAFGVDFGILGLFIYPIFIYYLFIHKRKDFNGVLLFIVFFVWGFASHNVLHEYFLILVYTYYNVRKKQNENLLSNQ
ncbi:O-antigen ligase family protein [Pedobacter sp. UC225_65]|uniref:O-antigen ligase family protein n=1 Tax=Pedobacter sp. UC225_65 TaxID=3350173 RepID=UPI0036706C47